MTAEEIKQRYTYKQLKSYNSEIRSRYNSLSLQYNQLIKKQEQIIERAVKERTKQIEEEHQTQLKEILTGVRRQKVFIPTVLYMPLSVKTLSQSKA